MAPLKKQLAKPSMNKYAGKESFSKKTIWHPESDLFWMSEKILEWFYNDEFGVIICHGQQGWGKSTYGCISGAEIYGHDLEKSQFYYNWEAVKRHLVWHPKQFIDLSKMIPPRDSPYYKVLPSTKKKEPLVLWDDAAYFLNKMKWNDKFCIEVGRYLEVARPRWGAVIFTVSHQMEILSKIRNIPHAWSVPIRKIGTPKRGNPNYRWQRDRRFARLHKSWYSEDLKKSGKKGKQGDLFYARMPGAYDPLYPDDPKKTYGFYGWYRPFREMFEEQGMEAVEIAAKELLLG